MKKIIKSSIITLFALSLVFSTGCEDLFEPAIENHKVGEDLKEMPSWALGLLGHAYIGNPLGSWSFNDVATDDAVSNLPSNNYRLMSTGAWSATYNPMDRWQYLRASWQYLNQFLAIVDDVHWADDPLASQLFKERFKGDAYGMRALYMYHLLLHHAGPSAADGKLLGIPIVTEPEDLYNTEFNVPRDSFEDCIKRLFADVDSAILYLPEDFGNVEKDVDVPAKYRDRGIKADVYTRIFGDNVKNRMSAKIARAIRAQAALLAASPAYSEGSGIDWEDAANYMAEALITGLGSNPVDQIDPNGGEWYKDNNAIKDLKAGENPKEILWRSNKEENANLERDNYPPTLFGSGRINPTQNLVDAFPTINGYPINHASSNYDPNNPYENRDPRLSRYIIYNGSKAGKDNTVINTSADSPDNNGINKIETSTRTGYYLRKLMNPVVNANPSATNNGWRYKPFIRYTELFLGYAEAANEAWGPTSDPNGHGFTAYDVVKAIRERAGITEGDVYLESIKDDKDAMRELIRNERRLELCFEGVRFWDLRRWKVPMEKLTETAKGVRISGTTYEVIDVERRAYKEHMYYGPIPFGEVNKFSELVQNRGW